MDEQVTPEADPMVSLEQRVSIIEERLGIDPHAVIADADESAARGAEAALLSEPEPELEVEDDEPTDEAPAAEGEQQS